MSTVGFLGLGSMGTGMVRRLLDGGHEVVAWNRSTGPVDELVAAGATRATSPEEALSPAVSFSMLANDQAAEEILGPSVQAVSGRIHVNSASISTAATARLATLFRDHEAGYVAAPVIGRPEVAAAGQLNILAAGPGDSVEAVAPYLEQLGKRVWRLGEDAPMASVVKIAVNYNIIHALQALGESIAMVERHGVQADLFVELLTSSLFGGVAYETYGTAIAARDYEPAFKMSLGYKDLVLAREVADAAQLHPATMPALFAVFERALQHPELAECDWSGIAEVSRQDLL
jgi:3-hydroxyisobutyrate dehydrogenase-like beta-hydroxyacid dehydrogenase